MEHWHPLFYKYPGKENSAPRDITGFLFKLHYVLNEVEKRTNEEQKAYPFVQA